MPVSSEVSVAGPYSPNGVTTAFPFAFKATAANEVVAVDGDGELISTALYSVDLDDDEGGTLTFGTAPEAATYPTLYVVSDPALTQPSDFDNTGPSFNPAALTRALDRAAARDLKQQREIDRGIKVPFGEDAAILPSAASRAGKFLGFSGVDGSPVAAEGTNPSDILRPDLASTDADKGAALVATDNGSTVQQVIDRQPLQVDAFYETGDAGDWGPAFERAFAAGKAQNRHIACTPGGTYSIWTNVDILPGSDGWTPYLYGNDATIVIGHTPIQSGDDSGGFRYRGIKSGEASNVSTGGMFDLTIDAQSVAYNSGVYSIFGENAGGLLFDNVNGRNYHLGMHIGLFRYTDGGAVSGPSIARNFTCTGSVLASTGDPTWYPYHNSCDLTLGYAGDAIAPAGVVPISTPQTTTSANGRPSVAKLIDWTNGTGSPINIPALPYTEADLVSAGLTKGGETTTLNGSTVDWAVGSYYLSGGVDIAGAAVPGPAGDMLENMVSNGGRYSAYFSGHDGPIVRNCEMGYGIRGLALEWTANGLEANNNTIRETLSSGVLLGYGCTDYDIWDTLIFAKTARWTGEALVNIQLSSGNGDIRRTKTVTRDNVTDGQYHLHIAMNSPHVRVRDFTAIGDCLRAYVCVESAWNNSISAANPEHYPQSAVYDGGASIPMPGIVLDGIKVIANTTKATAAGATAFCLMQVTDADNGDIAMPAPQMINCEALSNKHIRHFKIYEGSTAADQLNGMVFENCHFLQQAVPATAAIRMILPRKWAHFSLVKNVTNLDDELERAVPNVATPDLTFGKYWQDTSATALNGILGGQGASSSEGYNGREIVVRGNTSRAWSTISATSGTRDGLRITGSPITPTNVQNIVLRFNKLTASWIGGLT